MKNSGNYKKYSNKNPLMSIVISHFLNQVKSIIDSLDGDNILDIGCGEGFVINFLQNKDIIGLDISKDALTIAKAQSPDNRFFRGDIYNLPFQKDNFDIVIVMEVLEHINDVERAIDDVKRVSKKYCIFSVPNEPYFRLMNMLRGKNIYRFGNDIEHIQNWGTGEFVKLLERHLEVLEVKRPFPWTLVLCKKI